MPTIVDALVVQLGLDATGFKRGQREVNDAWQKARGNALKQGRAIEDSNKKLLESFNKLKIEALGFFTALLGAREIKDFVANITSANAAIGRLAANIGEQPQMLQAWGMAVERMGGKTEEAATSLTSLSKAFYDLRYNGKALPQEIYRVYAAAGRVPDTAHGLDKFLNDTAGALKQIAEHDRTAAFFFGQGMGLTPAMVSLMVQYGDATSKFVNAQKGLAATDEQIKNSQKLVEAWSKLADTAQQIGNDIANWFSPAFLKILDGVQKVFDTIHSVSSSMSSEQMQKLGKAMQDNTPGPYYPAWMYSVFGAPAGGGQSPGSDGKEITKSNPLPVQVVPNPSASSGAAGGGSSWWDWLTGGSGGGASSGGVSPSTKGGGHAPSGGGRAGLMRRLQQGASGGVSGTSGYYKADQQGRVLRLMDRLVANGWTPEAAAAAAGNAMQESNVLPNGAAGDGGRSKGMFQWDATRTAAGKAWAAANGRNWYDFDTQADYFNVETQKRSPAEANWRNSRDINSAGDIGYAFERFGDNSQLTRIRDAREALAVYNARKAGGSSAGDFVIGDSIAAGLEAAGRSNGSAMVGIPPQTVLGRIAGLTKEQLAGRRIILSSGASNDPSKVGLAAQQIDALRKLDVDPKNIRIMGVGDRGDFAGVNDQLQAIAKSYGSTFVPLGGVGADHVHPSDYRKLWQGIPGLGGGLPSSGVPLSHLQTVHPVTTSQTSNSMHIAGGINVHVPAGSDGHGIGSAIMSSLDRYGFASMAQSGQV